MTIYIQVKSVGKRRPILAKAEYYIPNNITTLRALISAIVQTEVETYNARGLENMLVPFLLESEIQEQATSGKVGFGRLYSAVKANPTEAVATALQGFEDGLFKVVLNETELTELDAPIVINENDMLTFVRLTFLAGRLW